MNNLFTAILKSSTDFRFYKEIYHQPPGKTLRYLALLALLVTLVLGMRYGIAMQRFSQKGFRWIEDNVPYIEITDGVVTADVEQPYQAEDEGFVMIIDTTGETRGIGGRYSAGVLLTGDKLIVKQNEIRTQEFDLSKVKSFRLDENTLGHWRKVFTGVLIPVMVLMQFVYFFIAKLIQAAAAGLVVLIFRPRFRYSQILSVCLYAVTPVTILAVVVILLVTKPPLYFPLIYLGMYIAFVLGGIRQVQTQ